MPDIIDRAQDHIEREAPHILANAKRPVGHRANGRCHNCGEPVPVGLYCDDDCRADFEHRQRCKGQTP